MIDNPWMDLAWAQAWQLTALIVVVAIAVRCFARSRPHLAYVLWLVVLAKCVTPPIIASPAGIFSRLQAAMAFDSRDAGPLVEAERKFLPPADWNDLIAATAQDESRIHEQGARQWKEKSAVGMGESEDEEWLSASARVDDPLHDRAESVIRQSSAYRSIAALWLTGSLLVIAAAGWRTMACLRRIARGDIESRPELQELLDDLRRRLRIRQRVRLLVTRSAFGPAVIGLFRPTIVLPSIVAAGRSTGEIEAILAHELIHIRRGDLWTGLVQILAQGVWWFHPLVWFANRRATRASEACCDQETITELGCAPGAYAESLLDILAIRNQLVPVPAFPGVRPVDVTRERLERIMQIGQGCPRRTPWWCWLAMVVVAAVTLPGAAIVAEGVADDPDSPTTQTAPQADPPAEPAPSSIERPFDKSTAENEGAKDKTLLSEAVTSPQPRRPFLHWNLAAVSDGQSEPGRPRILIEGDRLQQRPAKEGVHQSVVEADGGVMLYVGKVKVSATRALLHVTYRDRDRPKSIEEVSMELSGKVGWSSPDFRLATHRLTATFRIQGNPKGSVVALQTLSAQALDAEDATDADSSARASRLELFSRLPSELKDPRRLRVAAKKIDVKRHEMAKESGGDQIRYRLEGNVDARLANLVVACGECLFVVPVDPMIETAGHSPVGIAVSASFDKEVRLSGASDPAANAVLIEEFAATADRAMLHPFIYRQKDRGVCLGSSLQLSGRATFRNCDHELSASNMILKYSTRYPDPNSPQQPLQLTDQMELTGNVRITSRSDGQEQIVQGDRVVFDVSRKEVRIERLAPPGVDEEVPRLFGASVVFQPNLPTVKRAVEERSKDRRAEAGPNDLITTTYPVADLVVPVSKLYIKITEDGTNHLKMRLEDQIARMIRDSSPKSRAADFSRLIELLTSTVEPQSWDVVGGSGSIREYQTTLSLVIRQKQQVHDEIAQLLRQLRRLQDLQVTLELSALRVPADFKPELELSIDDQDVRGALITADVAATLRKAADENSHAGVYLLPRASLINGQGLEINVPQFGRQAPVFQFAPVIAADRKIVRLSLAVGAKDPLEAMSRISTFVIPAEKSLVVDVTDELKTSSVAGLRPGQVGAIRRGLKKDSGERFLLLITPRIMVQEEEELLGTASPK